MRTNLKIGLIVCLCFSSSILAAENELSLVIANDAALIGASGLTTPDNGGSIIAGVVGGASANYNPIYFQGSTPKEGFIVVIPLSGSRAPTRLRDSGPGAGVERDPMSLILEGKKHGLLFHAILQELIDRRIEPDFHFHNVDQGGGRAVFRNFNGGWQMSNLPGYYAEDVLLKIQGRAFRLATVLDNLEHFSGSVSAYIDDLLKRSSDEPDVVKLKKEILSLLPEKFGITRLIATEYPWNVEGFIPLQPWERSYIHFKNHPYAQREVETVSEFNYSSYERMLMVSTPGSALSIRPPLLHSTELMNEVSAYLSGIFKSTPFIIEVDAKEPRHSDSWRVNGNFSSDKVTLVNQLTGERIRLDKLINKFKTPLWAVTAASKDRHRKLAAEKVSIGLSAPCVLRVGLLRSSVPQLSSAKP